MLLKYDCNTKRNIVKFCSKMLQLLIALDVFSGYYYFHIFYFKHKSNSKQDKNESYNLTIKCCERLFYLIHICKHNVSPNAVFQMFLI